MSKTIQGIPDHLTRGEWAEMFRQFGFEPEYIQELRFAPDGVHAIVFDRDAEGHKILTARDGHLKHRVFIPVRDGADDTRTTRITKITKD